MSNYQGNIIIKNPATPTGPFENGSAPGVWTLSEAMTFKRQGIWPTQGVQSSDAYFKYVSLLLSTTALGNANNNLFVDSSGAFNPISRNGNTTQGSFTPYSANWSNYFDGDGDYLTFANNAAFGFGTGDYTVEFWIYLNTLPASNKYTIVDFRTAAGAAPHTIYVNTSGYLGFFNGSTDVASSSAPMTANSWTHIAYSRSSGTLRIYVNGVQAYSAANTIDYQSSRQCRIGAAVEGIEGIPGYISNFRVVKGTGLYTSAFTPPSSALTAVSGTTLLTCQSNRFRDASSNNFTATVNGNTSVTDFAPFSPTAAITYNQSDITNWSGYFDGSGDYLYAPNNTALDIWDNGSSSFTVEAWIFATASIPNNVSIVGKATLDGNTPFNGWAFQVFSGCLNVNTASNNRLFTNSTAVPLNQWVHVALVKSGSTISIYQNGTRVSTITNTSTYSNTADQLHIAIDRNPAGSSLTGYMSNLRIVKGVAVYDPTQSTLTVPTSALTAVSGTSLLTLQNAAFTDNSSNKFLLTQYGNVTVTGNSPFNPVGYWSNYFDGSGDYLSLSNKITFGTGDFTVEGWVYRLANTSIYDGFFSLEGTNGDWNSGGGGIAIACGNLHLAGYGNINYSSSVPLNQWTHIACSRSGTSVKVFLNGSEVASATSSTSLGGTAGKFPIIGGFDTLGGNSPRFPLTGFISNLRTVTGTALYTSTFTPPTAPLTAISGTSLLTCQNGRFIDNSTNAFAITVNGNTSIQSFDPFYTSTIASNGGSMYFDGSGDELGFPINPVFTLGSSDFTIEGWLYPTSLPSDSTAFVLDSNLYPRIMWIYTGGAFHVYASASGSSWQIDQTPAVVIGQWNHLVFQRNGNDFRTFLNGVLVATTTSALTFPAQRSVGYIGRGDSTAQRWNGYISNFRITTGSAIYSTGGFTPPTAPVTPTPATTLLVNGMNAGIYDATGINDMETVGNAQVSTVQSKFDGSSLYFDGSGDYIFTRNVPEIAFGTGNFTIELWAYIAGNSAVNPEGNRNAAMASSINASSPTGIEFTLLGNGSVTGTGLSFANWVGGTQYLISGSTSISQNAWHHFAVVRNGTTTTLYVDGVSIGSGTLGNQTINPALPLQIGQQAHGSFPHAFNGYIDEFRITKGIARYTANFTPPTNPFQLY